jgi:cytochrome c oxidase subunit 2
MFAQVQQVQLFPEAASTHADQVDALFFFILGITIFFTVLIAVTILTFAIRYRRRSDADRPPHIEGSLRLEIAWSVVPLAIALGIYLWSARIYFSWGRPPDDTVEVYCVAHQWMWKFQHAGGQREINELHVPLGRPVKVTMISKDVIHSFFVPEFRTHQDVLPGRYTYVWFEATKPGTYNLFCSQYCGTNHSQMIGKVIVLEPDAYQTWLEQHPDGAQAAEGRKLFFKLQCITCHSADADARAPVLEGLYGRRVQLQGGDSVLADTAYYRESILYPTRKVVAGYQNIMPSYEGQVTEEELLQLIVYLKGLGPGQTPRRNERAEPPAVDRPQKQAQKP